MCEEAELYDLMISKIILKMQNILVDFISSDVGENVKILSTASFTLAV